MQSAQPDSRLRQMYELRKAGLSLQEIGDRFAVTRQAVDQLLRAGARRELFSYPIEAQDVPQMRLVEAITQGKLDVLRREFRLTQRQLDQQLDRHGLTKSKCAELVREWKRQQAYEDYCELVADLGAHPSTKKLQDRNRYLDVRIRSQWGSIHKFRAAFGIQRPPHGNLGRVQEQTTVLGDDAALERNFAALIAAEKAAALAEDYSRPDAGTPRRLTTTARRIGQDAFRAALLAAYAPQCAFCGLSIHVDGSPALEAAHIVSVDRNGATHVRNGLLLCKLDHWLLDKGAVLIDERLRLMLNPNRLVDDTSRHLERLVGKAIPDPRLPYATLDPRAAALHRATHLAVSAKARARSR